MKLTRTLLLVGAGLGSSAFALQDAQTIQRTLTENTTEVYKIDSKVNQTIESQQMGEMPLNVTSAMTYQINTGKVDPSGGTAAVQVTVSVDKMDADGPLGDLLGQQKIKPVIETGTIDKFGHMVLEAPKAFDLMEAAMAGTQTTQSSMFIELPNHPVKVGDTWTIAIPKSAFMSDDQSITAKLVGDKTVDGKSVWVVDVTGNVTTVIDSTKMPSSGDSPSPLSKMKFVCKQFAQVDGEGFVDKATGRTVSYTTGGKMKNTIEIPDHDMTIDANGTYSSTVKLQS
jgi:hypothetical protein